MSNDLVSVGEVLEGELLDGRPYIHYSSNNSGGSWWLDDADWRDLEKAGWEVDWVADWPDEPGFLNPRNFLDGDGRYLGALATSAKRYGVSLFVAVAEWQDATGLDPDAAGCGCCGYPHSFTAYDANDNPYDSY